MINEDEGVCITEAAREEGQERTSKEGKKCTDI